MIRRLCGLSLALGFLVATPLSAQDVTIVGTVTNQAGDPIPGAEVYVQGATDRGVGTVTNVQGRYQLRIPSSLAQGREITVVARSIGYATAEQEVTLAGGTMTLDFVLRETALSLDEIVVTGVVDPVQGKKLPFTVGKVTAENVATVPATGAALSSLQGKVAGVNITRPSGQPGTEVSVQLRTPTSVFTGNQPLFVVDGVILGAGTIDIEALDIESIEVIKGAAAASLYGSRAAAGVIQIRTARGTGLAMDQTRITYRTEAGASGLPRRIPLREVHWHVVHEGEPYVDDYGRTVNPGDRIDRNGNKGCSRRKENCFGFVNNPGQIADTPYTEPLYDHLGSFFRPGRFMTQALTVSQNSERTNFLTSINYYDEAGSIPGQEGYERYNFRFNLDHRIMESLTLSFSGYHNRSDRDDILEGENGSTGQGPFFQLGRYNREVDISKKDENGNYLQFPDSAYWQENPLFIAATRDNWQKRARTLGNLALNYSPLAWMRVSGQFSYDRLDQNDQWHLPAGTPINPFSGRQETYPAPGMLDLRERIVDTQNGMLSTTFSHPFGELNPRLTFSGSFERRDLAVTRTRGDDFAVWGSTDVNLARNRFIQSDRETVKANGYFTDLALDYAGKYIGSFLVRRDGSSLFGPEERWHTYYRAALAYRMAEEPWWPLSDVVTEFKPRYSIGTAGNRPNFDYQYETWNVSVSDDGQTVNFARGTLGNRALKPEFAREQEFGVDLAFFDRYLLQLTYASQRTEDLILRLPQRAVTGYQFQWNNVGAMEGSTVEANLEASLVQSRDLQWTVGAVLDRSSSVITDWPIAPLRRGVHVYDEGNSLYDIYGSRFLTSMDQLSSIGIAPEDYDQFDVNDDGYLVWVGAGNTWRDGLEDSGNGRVNWMTNGTVNGVNYNWGVPIADFDPETGEQRTYRIGSMQPDLNYGFMSNLTWRGFSVHGHLRGQVGGDVYNYTRQRMYRLGQHGDMDQSGKAEERKKRQTYYRFGLFNGDMITDAFVEDATFLKLQALQVAYTFGQNQLARVLGSRAPSNLKLGLTGRNLFTLTGYTGYDPDVGTVLNRYDSFGYPNLRQVTAAVEITF